MSSNIWTNFLALSSVLGIEDQQETRIENDVNGKILYIGIARSPSAPTNERIWFITKLGYDVNGFLDYKQLPVDGPGFVYVWDDRATYF